MSCNLEHLGAIDTFPLPATPQGFPLQTTEDLRRAYREYAKYNDERLIFDTPQLELSPEGCAALTSTFLVQPAPNPSSEDYWDDLFSEGNHIASDQATQAQEDYWTTLKQRIDAFIATPHGQTAANELAEALYDYIFSNFSYTGPIPDDLYERIVTAELCWRDHVKALHKKKHPELYQKDAPMEVQIITAFDGDKAVTQMETLQVPASHSFTDFGIFMAHQSRIPAARETDLWYYPNPSSTDVHSPNHFIAITEVNYGNLKKLLIETPKREEGRKVDLLLWHTTQIEYVRVETLEEGGVDLWSVRGSEGVVKEVERELDRAVEEARVAREMGRNAVVSRLAEDNEDDDRDKNVPQRMRSYL